MDLILALVWFIGVILSILVVVGFFSIWHHVDKIHQIGRVVSGQLDQLLRAHAVEDPLADREKMVKEGRAHW